MYASASLKDICSTEPICVHPDASVFDVLNILHEQQISSVIVVEGKRPIGLFTEHDAMLIFARGLAAESIPVSAVTSSPPVVAPCHIDFFEAYHLCVQNGVRHLIVVNELGELYGIATDTDFMKILGLDVLSGQEKVEQVMNTTPLSISPHSTLSDVVTLMVELTRSAAIIVDNEQPIGIVTQRDLVRLSRIGTPSTTPVSEVMTTPLLTVQAQRSVYHAIEIMRKNRVRSLVVLGEQEQLLGLMSEHDVVKKIEERYVGILTTIIKRQMDDIKRIRHELDEKHVLSAVLHQSLGVGLVVADPLGKVHYMNPSASSLYDLSPTNTSDIALRCLFEKTSTPNQHLEAAFDAARLGKHYEFGSVYYDGGSQRELHMRIAPIQDQDGHFLGVVQAIQDVTERNHSERKLKQAASIFENTIEGVIVTDANAKILSVNPAFTRITGYEEDEVRGKNPKILSSGRQDHAFYKQLWETLLNEGYWQGEIWNRRKSGEAYAEWLTISVVSDEDGKLKNYLAVFADITSAKRVHDEYEFLAHHDALTSLPNRLLLNARLAHSLARSIRTHIPIAVLMLDLDGFKLINDRYGHEAGDQVLEIVASRLATLICGDNTVARLGGDEFAIVLEDLDAPQTAIDIANKLILELSEPLELGGHEIRITVSIGIAISSAQDRTSGILLKHADQALYLAKSAGKNTCRIYPYSEQQETYA